jgi:hypothetical protein
LTEFQVRAAKKRLDELTVNKAFRHGSPVSTRYLFRIRCHSEPDEEDADPEENPDLP